MSTVARAQAVTAAPRHSAGASLLLQRKCACGGQASTLTGECEECSKKKIGGLQTKLRVNEPGDVYEQEADRVAEQVLAKPTRAGVSSAPLRIQRYTGPATRQAGTAPASVDRVLATPGEPLDSALRQDMEQRFGHDFSRVRVHAGAMAEQSVRDLNALAYTTGHHLVFGAAQSSLATRNGRQLLAHELTHVVQQAQYSVKPVQRKQQNTDEHWAALAATGERLSQASSALYQVEPEDDRRLLEIIEPVSPVSALATQNASASKVAEPFGGKPEQISSPFRDYGDLQTTLRTFEHSLFAHLSNGAAEVLDATEARLHTMYALYVGKGPHLSWLENVHAGYAQHGPGWLERHIATVREDPDVIRLTVDHDTLERAIDREQDADDAQIATMPEARDYRHPANGYFNDRRKERKRRRDTELERYNASLRRVLASKSPLLFLPGFRVSSFLAQKSGEAQNRLIGFIAQSGLNLRRARTRLSDPRFVYGADILINRVKDCLAERLGQAPGFNHSWSGEDPVFGPAARGVELSRRIETLNSIIDSLARERRAESTLWEDIVKVLEVLSTFAPGPIGWGVRLGVAAASFDIKVGRTAEQVLLHGTGLSSAAPDPNAVMKAFGEAAVQVLTDSPLSGEVKTARSLTLELEKDLPRNTVKQRKRAIDTAANAGHGGERSPLTATADVPNKSPLTPPPGESKGLSRIDEAPSALAPSPQPAVGVHTPPRPTALTSGSQKAATTPRGPGQVTKFLQQHGLAHNEILRLGGGRNAKRLGPVTANRVERLLEHFSPEDLKALGAYLNDNALVLDDAAVEALIEGVGRGKMREVLRRAEVAATHGEATRSLGWAAEAEVLEETLTTQAGKVPIRAIVNTPGSTALGASMEAARRPRPALGYHAHHIIPEHQFAEGMDWARNRLGTGINSAENGAWLAGSRATANPELTRLHNSYMHAGPSVEYAYTLTKRLADKRGPAFLDEVRLIGREMERGSFKIEELPYGWKTKWKPGMELPSKRSTTPRWIGE